MPVYNSAEFIKESVESILAQSYTNFELLILNDGSKDNSLEIISSIKDPRIVILHSESNHGIVFQLNKGIEHAKGEYIARMDSDDIARPERFEKQLRYLETNPEVAICGTYVECFPIKRIIQDPVTPIDVKTTLLFKNCLSHPSLMIRKKVLENYNLYYDQKFIYAEDFELLARASHLVKIVNIPEALLNYRVQNNQITTRFKKEMLFTVNEVKNIQLSKLIKDILNTDVEFNYNVLTMTYEDSVELFKKLNKYIPLVLSSEISPNVYEKKILTKEFIELFSFYNHYLQKFGLKLWWQLIKYPFYNKAPLSLKTTLFIKCLINYKTSLNY